MFGPVDGSALHSYLGFAWRIRARLSLLLHSTTADRNSTGFGGKNVENPVELVKVPPPLRQKIDGVKGHTFACENLA
jgi:hypothetical protein